MASRFNTGGFLTSAGNFLDTIPTSTEIYFSSGIYGMHSRTHVPNFTTTYIDQTSVGSLAAPINSITQTYSSSNIGTLAGRSGRRLCLIVIHVHNGTGSTTASMTVGGLAATGITGHNSGSYSVSGLRAQVSMFDIVTPLGLGNNEDIVFTIADTLTIAKLYLYELSDAVILASGGDTDSSIVAPDGASVTLTTTTSAVVIQAASTLLAEGTAPIFSNITITDDSSIDESNIDGSREHRTLIGRLNANAASEACGITIDASSRCGIRAITYVSV